MADKIILTSGKRRTAIARSRLKKSKSGKANIRINGVPIENITPEFSKIRMMEPLILAEKFIKDDMDFKIRVHGGGVVSQAEAVRMAIARALNEYLGKEEVRQIFEDYDRTMIAGDVRRTEPKKAGGRGARARFQKSYR
jgi:small subunit ribosomal protein S9